jgi:hypothetical protein
MSSGQWRGATCLHRAATALGSRHTRGVPHQWPQRCHASLDLRGRASRRGTGTTSGAAPLVHGRGRAAGAHTGVVLWLPINAQHDGGTARLIPVWFKKVDRLAVLVAIMKHLSLDFARHTRTVLHCKLSSSEAALWDSALGNEQTRCQRPVYIMEMQEQHGRLLSPSHAGGVNPPTDDDGGQEIIQRWWSSHRSRRLQRWWSSRRNSRLLPATAGQRSVMQSMIRWKLLKRSRRGRIWFMIR